MGVVEEGGDQETGRHGGALGEDSENEGVVIDDLVGQDREVEEEGAIERGLAAEEVLLTVLLVGDREHEETTIDLQQGRGGV